jgi:hypothetical protein
MQLSVRIERFNPMMDWVVINDVVD